MSQRIDRTGQSYGQLIALYDTGKSTKRGECMWAAKCQTPIAGGICGRVIETYKLGQTDGPTRCPECSVALFCTPRDITGQEFSGWKAVSRVERKSGSRDLWLIQCLTCPLQATKNVSNRSCIAPCRNCHRLVRTTPKRPQKVTTRVYPLLGYQIGLTRLKLAKELAAGKVVEVPVGGGRYPAFVEASDAPRVVPYNWNIYAGGDKKHPVGFYARATVNGKNVSMHRLILDLTDPNVITDHQDHCGINNTRKNIRPATHQQNGANTRKRSGDTSKYKGVSWKTAYGQWVSTIELGGKKKHLGYFDDEADAARIYNDAARELFGEFACLNDVPPIEAVQATAIRKPPANVGLEQIAIA